MTVYRCRLARAQAVLALVGLSTVFLLTRRDSGPSEDAVSKVWSHLQPTFSAGRSGSPFSPPDLSMKEALEARVLALRAHCERKEEAGDSLQRRHSKLETALRGERAQLTWCAHPLTLDSATAVELERLADQNTHSEIRLDRENYFSMPGDGGDAGHMSWHIVEHPLLVLTRAFLELRSGQTRWAVPAGRRSGPSVTLAEVLELAVTDDPLPAAADSCAVCAGRYDFVLHAGDLSAEVPFLASEMGWSNTWEAGEAAEADRRAVVRELVHQLPTVPRHLLLRVKQRFRRDLRLYGFRMDLDALLEAAQ